MRPPHVAWPLAAVRPGASPPPASTLDAADPEPLLRSFRKAAQAALPFGALAAALVGRAGRPDWFFLPRRERGGHRPGDEQMALRVIQAGRIERQSAPAGEHRLGIPLRGRATFGALVLRRLAGPPFTAREAALASRLAVPLTEALRLREAEAEAGRLGERFEDLEALGSIGSFERLLRPTEHSTWSAGLSRIFGLPETPAPSSLAELLGHVHPDDREKLGALVRGAAESGTGFVTGARVVRADGGVRHVLVRGRARLGFDGRPDAISGAVVDVTDLKRIEAELAVKARALDLMQDSVFILDAEGRFVDANEAAYRTRGYTRDEFLAMDIRSLDAPEFARKAGDRLAKIAASGGAMFESAHRRKDGAVMPVEISGRAMEAGGRHLLVSTVRDITRRKAREEALRRSTDELRRQIEAAEERNRQISCLAQMGRELQACTDRASVWPRVATFLERLYPGLAGEILEVAREDQTVGRTAAWGGDRPALGPLPAECAATRWGCAALERGLVGSIECRQAPADPGTRRVCVPILQADQPPGILRFWERTSSASSGSGLLDGHQSSLAVAAAEQVSVVLANLDLREALEDLVMRDPLTGLYNRRFLEEALERELARARREDLSVGILMLDLDHFKDFNDAYGHEAGDDALRRVGAFLKGRIRVTDIACRYGGEEFTILLPGATLDDSRARAEEIRTGIREMLGDRGVLAASLGAAVFPYHADGPVSLLRAADTALYRAKALGRNRVETFVPA